MRKRSKKPTTSTTGRDTIKDILDSIRRIVRGLRVASRASEKRFGLSAAQLFVLQKLGQAKGLSLNELAGQTLTHQSSVSVVVSRLVKQGLVNRKTSTIDARRIEMSLTPAGRKFLTRSFGTIQERMIRAMQRMTPHHRRNLAESLGILVTESGLASEAPSLFFEDNHGIAAQPHAKRTEA